MNAKQKLARVLAPVADRTAQRLTGMVCMAIFHQPKLPKKLKHTVK